MKRSILPACALALPFVVASAFAADAPVMDETSRMNYALGYQIGRDLAGTEVKADALVKGLDDGSKGAAPALKPEEMEAALTLLQQRVGEQRAKQQAAEMQQRSAAGAAYLAEKGLTMPVLLDGAGELAAQLDVTYLPTTFFVDEAGVIRSRVRRTLTLEEMQTGVKALHRDAD